MSGLSVTFSNTDLERIPYNRLVEVPFSVTNTAGSIALCNVFNDDANLVSSMMAPPTLPQSAAVPGLSHSYGSDAADTITDIMLWESEESKLSNCGRCGPQFDHRRSSCRLDTWSA